MTHIKRIDELCNNKNAPKFEFDFNQIPEDVGYIEENIPEGYAGIPPYTRYEYFGDCRNTVDVDHIWTASQMSYWICNDTHPVNIEYVLDKLYGGDRKIPKTLLNNINKLKLKNKINDLGEIVCALDDHQKIMFIYLSKTDIHYFFDCFK